LLAKVGQGDFRKVIDLFRTDNSKPFQKTPPVFAQKRVSPTSGWGGSSGLHQNYDDDDDDDDDNSSITTTNTNMA
jgi:hypothetical protein